MYVWVACERVEEGRMHTYTGLTIQFFSETSLHFFFVLLWSKSSQVYIIFRTLTQIIVVTPPVYTLHLETPPSSISPTLKERKKERKKEYRWKNKSSSEKKKEIKIYEKDLIHIHGERKPKRILERFTRHIHWEATCVLFTLGNEYTSFYATHATYAAFSLGNNLRPVCWRKQVNFNLCVMSKGYFSQYPSNVKGRLEFEFADYNIAVQRINHYAQRAFPFFFTDRSYFFLCYLYVYWRALSVMAIVEEKGIGNSISNPGRGSLRFTSR